jgi:quercetin dioxygenase-like cupin family protein
MDKRNFQEACTINRREACAGLAAFSMLGGLLAQAQTLPGAGQPDAAMDVSRVVHFDEMKLTHNANGGWGRAVMHGTLPTGEFLEVHETMLPAGKMPHPPHRHSNSEFLLIREGKLLYLTDGVKEPVGPADVIYTASNRPHGLKNIGDTPALYFVVSVGVQDKATPVTLKD